MVYHSYCRDQLNCPLQPDRCDQTNVIYKSDVHAEKLLDNTVNSRFKKDLKLRIHQHKAFFLDDRFLDSLHKSFLNQTTLDLRKEKWTFLNQEFTVPTKNILVFSFSF